MGLSSHAESSKYIVQVRYKYIPFWISITRSFNELKQAEEHIILKLKEYNNG